MTNGSTLTESSLTNLSSGTKPNAGMVRADGQQRKVPAPADVFNPLLLYVYTVNGGRLWWRWRRRKALLDQHDHR